VCATTGRAAINVGGTTVDSLFCFSRGKWSVFSERVLEKYMQSTHKIILIDEASMVGEQMGNLLITLAERYDKRLVLVEQDPYRRGRRPGEPGYVVPVQATTPGERVAEDVRHEQLG